jgi:uncharacterized protein (DUF2267 family)
MPETAAAITTLREALAVSFNFSELEILCVDLGVNPESVPQRDEGIETWAMELVAYFHRRNRLNDLVARCAKDRPQVPWGQLAVAHAQVMSAAQQADSYDGIQKGIAALTKLAEDPKAWPAIAQVRDELQIASDNIARLGHFKRLHDEFQELENRYIPIEEDCQRALSDSSAWFTLSVLLSEWDEIIDKLSAIVAQAKFAASEAQWLPKLKQAQATIRTAQEAQDAKPLEPVLRAMRRTLEREPSLLNAKLVEVVRAMLHSGLIARLTELSASLGTRAVDAASLDEFASSLNALKSLRDRLQVLVTEHDRWQALQDELNPIESNISRDPDVLAQSWLDVSDRTRAMLDGMTERWADSLLKLDARIRDLLQTQAPAKDWPAIRRLFTTFYSAVVNRFRQVDDDLLAVVGELDKMGEGLNAFLRRFI